MELKSYWDATAKRFDGAARGSVQGAFDVAIVGGGFTGLSCALALSRKGASVVVLEADRVVGEASGRNGGQVNNGLGASYRAVREMVGLHRARSLYQSYNRGVDLIEKLTIEEKIDCGFCRNGKLKLAFKPQHFNDLRADYDIMAKEVDSDLQLFDGREIKAEVGSEVFHGGLLYGKSAQMHVGAFGAALAAAAVRRGAQIYEHAAVTKLDRQENRHRIETERGTVTAKQTLLATGASRKGPFSWIRRRIVPIGSFIIATEPLSENVIGQMLPHRRNCVTTRNIGNYFSITRDNRLLFGGRARFAISNPASDAKSGGILKETMLGVFPCLKGTRIEYCWGGTVDMTADRLPRAGVRDGIYYSMGYSGHGTQMSVLMGHAMADVIDGRPGANPLRDLDWPAIKGHFGPPWFLPLVGAYYRFKDAIS